MSTEFLTWFLVERDEGRCVAVTVDKELFADTLPTYLTRFAGSGSGVRDGAVDVASGAAHHGLWGRRFR